MFFKSMQYAHVRHVLKITFPFVLVLFVFILRSSISSPVGAYTAERLDSDRDAVKSLLSAKDVEFSTALADLKNIDQIKKYNYSVYVNRGFIQRQKNGSGTMKEGDGKINNPAPAGLYRFQPRYDVSSVFIGTSRRYAVIDGRIYVTGDKLESGEHVSAILKGKVLLQGHWGDRWLYVDY
ncbi:hypothetical protein Dacet_0347 [Denitrovibrio acetiphilus DSM 12809]|uniref:Uncharacterized protein n=1 Tax=Denitrovibrio acetiphilus (strain DSM 12809 / NBRC 114555 / N2460) TaxID=522772 RepID=D4H2T6_DENA2|nr:hypothetical protein [Denitrovibrio acetiphilus]ADD67147.1 hypothetical protein Dacet_0347 [Denitrovibrio acetiphilus DSM 12809]